MKYKTGDRVKIREDLIEDEEYGGHYFVSRMEPWRGKTVTIVHCGKYDYLLEGCAGFLWTDEMIEGLAVEDDAVNHPSHYTDGKIEVIDFIRDKHLDFCRGNVVKYLCRAGKKSKETELEDLKKAMQYCQFAIEELEGKHE